MVITVAWIYEWADFDNEVFIVILGIGFNFFLFIYLFIFIFIFFLFAISWAAPAAYGGSQARGQIGAVATGLRQSHNSAGSEPCLQPTPQLTAMLDPQPTEQSQGWNPSPQGY